MFKRAGSREIDRARQLRRDATEFEKRLWWKLRELNALGYHFRRQSPFLSYTLDFVEHDARLVIELDGDQHGDTGRRQHDEKRDSVLATQGYRTLRFWNSDMIENPGGVLDTVVRELEQRRPPTRRASLADLPTKGEVKKKSKPLPRKGVRRIV